MVNYHKNTISHPWLISTLNYLEYEIEKWSIRANMGQAGPGGTKRDQGGPNGPKSRPGKSCILSSSG